MDKIKWLIPLVLGLTLLFAGWAYTSTNWRIRRNETTLDTIIPILYRIETKVENIEKILAESRTKTPDCKRVVPAWD